MNVAELNVASTPDADDIEANARNMAATTAYSLDACRAMIRLVRAAGEWEPTILPGLDRNLLAQRCAETHTHRKQRP